MTITTTIPTEKNDVNLLERKHRKVGHRLAQLVVIADRIDDTEAIRRLYETMKRNLGKEPGSLFYWIDNMIRGVNDGIPLNTPKEGETAIKYRCMFSDGIRCGVVFEHIASEEITGPVGEHREFLEMAQELFNNERNVVFRRQ